MLLLLSLLFATLSMSAEMTCGQHYDQCVREIDPTLGSWYAAVTGVFSSSRNICEDGLKLCVYLHKISV